MKQSWSTFAIIVGAAPLQILRDTGHRQYAALRVTRVGGVLSHTLGVFETAQSLQEATEPRFLGDVPGFYSVTHIPSGFLAQYAALFQAAVGKEPEYKAEAARLSVEEYREKGRQPVRNPMPKRNRQKRAS